MNFNTKLLSYFILVLLSFSIERLYIKCKNPSLYTVSVSFFHHMFAAYLYFGTFIFKFHLFNIFILLLTILGWVFNNNRCFLSVYYNKICGLDNKEQFHDLVNYVNKYLQIKNLHYYIAIMIIIYNLYFLYFTKN